MKMTRGETLRKVIKTSPLSQWVARLEILCLHLFSKGHHHLLLWRAKNNAKTFCCFASPPIPPIGDCAAAHSTSTERHAEETA